MADRFMSPNNQEKVNEELFELDGDLTLFNGEPFTGVGFYPFPSGGGVEYETEYKNGLPHGASKKWYSSGQLAYETECKNGVTHGREAYWYPDGSLKSEANYEFGIKLSLKAWNENGEIIEEFKIDSESTNYALLEKFRAGDI